MIKIFLYTDGPSSSFNIDEAAIFLSDGFYFHVSNRGDLFNYLGSDKEELLDFQSYIETIKINDLESPLDDLTRKSFDKGVDSEVKGDFIDGYWLQRRLFSYMSGNPAVDFSENHLHLIITGKLFGTYGDKRYHARVLLTGEPALISTSGVVEAPAKPREYYFVKANLLSMGRKIAELDELYRDRFVDYDDSRITRVVCSYALQQVKSMVDGSPFCENENCCLYNSHWQEEVLNLQYRNILCDRCSGLLLKR